MDGVTLSPRKRGGLFSVSRAWLSMLFLIALVGPAVAVPATTACAQEADGNVGVVIDFTEEAEDQDHCVDTEEADDDGDGALTGIEVLLATDAEVMTQDFGGDLGIGVCKIDDLGDDDCSFTSGFWAYFVASEDGEWEFAQTGAAQTERQPGDVDGWVWTPTGQEESDPPSQDPDLDAICPAASPTPAAVDEEPQDEGIPLTTWLVVAGAVLVLLLAFLLLRGRGTSA